MGDDGRPCARSSRTRSRGASPAWTTTRTASPARKQARATRDVAVRGGGLVAVLPIHGVIAPRMNLLSEVSGGTTFEGLTKQLQRRRRRSGRRDDRVRRRLAGRQRRGRERIRARGHCGPARIKPIIVQAQSPDGVGGVLGLAGATEIVASPSAMVGSIGVYRHSRRPDRRRARSSASSATSSSAGKYKAEGVGGDAARPRPPAPMRNT